MDVENRDNVVIENSRENIKNNGNRTYAEVVSSKNKTMTSVSRQVTFEDETKRNKTLLLSSAGTVSKFLLSFLAKGLLNVKIPRLLLASSPT